MISLGMAFDLERDYKYLPFMVLIAFVMLMFFLLTISRSNLNRHLKTVFFRSEEHTSELQSLA